MLTRYYNPLLILLAVLSVTIGCAVTVQAETGEADTPQTPPTDQADKSEGTALLHRIEAASSDMRTLTARVRYTRLQTLTGDEQKRFGDFYYAAPDEKQPTRFAVIFDRLYVDGRTRPIQTWFIFDGRWLLERDHDDKQAVRRELVPKGAEKRDTLSLGDGQLPIPLKLKADEVLKSYKVTRLPDEPLGEQALYRLRLTPRKAGEDAPPMDLWFDSQSLLLHKLVTMEDADEIEMLFHEPKRDVEIKPSVFATQLPDAEKGWDAREVKLKD